MNSSMQYPTITDVWSATKVLSFFIVGSMLAFYATEIAENKAIANKIVNLSYVTLSLLVTSMWAVWQAQESISDVSLLSRLSRKQINKIQLKRSYTRNRVQRIIAIALLGGAYTTFGNTLVNDSVFLILSGGITGLFSILFIQNLLAYFEYSNLKAQYQTRIAKIDKIERNKERFQKKND